MTVALSCALLVGCDKRSAADKNLFDAIRQGDSNYVQNYLSADTDNKDRLVVYATFGRVSAPPIDLAIYAGQMGILDQLLSCGADPNLPDWEGYTPLTWALGKTPQGKQIQCIKRLLDAGADPNKTSGSYQTTPLMDAAAYGDAESVAILLVAGADVRHADITGMTALHYASTAEVARLLLNAGAALDAVTTNGSTPATTARSLKHFDALKVLTNASSASSPGSS